MKLQITEDTITHRVGEGDDAFTLTLRRPTEDELKTELQAAIETLSRRLSFIVGWSGVHDANDQPIAFTPDVLTQAIRSDHAFTERVVRALQTVIEGLVRDSVKGE